MKPADPAGPAASIGPAERPATAADPRQRRFTAVRGADHAAAGPQRHPVVVVGAGPVGLSLAIDLAQRGVPVVLLDADDRLCTGSRAICFAKRTLEIFDRLGCGEWVVAGGVSWNVGRVFFRDRPIYRFDLLPEAGHQRPAFVNLPQYAVESLLVERAAALPLVDLRWQSRLTGVEPQGDRVLLTVEAPDGAYRIAADHVVACDGAHSTVRRAIGQESTGRAFDDRFLIADVRMDAAGFPAERWFWFEPPFHPGGSVLLHRQPGGVWRIDFQLGPDADPDEEKKPERIVPRVRALLGADTEFELEWASVYTFACRRMASFRHGRVLFAGDAAHGVSPFGARGANSGVQDADNLAWKLAAVVGGQAPGALLDSYAVEREAAADENIAASTRATDFISPKSDASRLFRDAVLDLAGEHAFARTLVNSGRLSVPAVLHASPLNTPDADAGDDAFAGCLVPGAPAADAPVRRADGGDGWLLRQLGDGFTALLAGGGVDDGDEDGRDGPARWLAAAAEGIAPLTVLRIVAPGDAVGRGTLIDVDGLVAQRYGLRPGSVVLLRPDRHVCARWRRPTAAAVTVALKRALALALA